MTEPAEDTFGSTVYRVAVRLPPIWPDQPALSFVRSKEQFELAAVTRQRTKFTYVASQHAAEVEDIIASPVRDPNDRLKKQNWCAGCAPHANNA